MADMRVFRHPTRRPGEAGDINPEPPLHREADGAPLRFPVADSRNCLAAASPMPSESTSARTRRIHKTLRSLFGLEQLRDGQREIIDRVLDGRPTLAVMPTGAGKSLCYQLPALLLDGRTVVVSPLIALMKDQCQRLRERGIAAVQLNSAVDPAELRAAEAAIVDGSARIVLTTPERLADPAFLALLQQGATSLLAVDEAHCISQWGHDFRPAYLEIAHALRALGQPTVLALTATATDEVADDIRRQLGIPRDGTVDTGAYRANLDYRVEHLAREDEKLARTVALVRESRGSGLVYAATVKAAEAVYEKLAAAGESVARYHGKMRAAERHAVQESFMAGTTRVVVATNAFGLGIDKADIRFVLHYQMPAGLDAYYQESGRAGRDGAPAACTLLFLRSDKAVQQFFMAGRYPTLDDLQAIYGALLQRPPEGPSGWTLDALQSELDRPRAKLQVGLSLLRRQRIAVQDRHGAIALRKREIDAATLDALMQAYRRKREQDVAMLEHMVDYAQSGQCRWQMLLRHFDGGHGDACGHCDNCRRLAEHRAEQAGSDGRGAQAMPALRPEPIAVSADPAPPSLRRRKAGEGSHAAPVRVRKKRTVSARASAAALVAALAVAPIAAARAGSAANAVPTGLVAAAPQDAAAPPAAAATGAASPQAQPFAPGDRVEVRRYGQGTVKAVDALSVTVVFPDRSRRSFRPDFVVRAPDASADSAAPADRADAPAQARAASPVRGPAPAGTAPAGPASPEA
jgi:ATP-dependent DNA helicase RecQ